MRETKNLYPAFGLIFLLRTAEAFAIDASPSMRIENPIPESYRSHGLIETKTFPANDFRPRGNSMSRNQGRGAGDDAAMLRGTTVWQRLKEYGSKDRVRLLTLWETAGSSVSLQANKKGVPSVQWTSRLMNRGGSTRGLFDQLFSISLSAAGGGLRTAAHARSAELPGRQAVGLERLGVK